MYLNATLFIQIIVFAILWWFVAKFVWPPITTALDDRAKRISDGLAAADKAKADLAVAERRVEAELKEARAGAAEVRRGAETHAAGFVAAARAAAARILTAAKKQAEEEAGLAAQRARDDLRDQVATLAVAGAERILRKEIDAGKHADLLTSLKSELR
ncbi:MAG: F0F1 ATP synthase subunit B [Burkholderiaceae bacterium]